jgi:diadenosine tetraphosphate (Ap4A) HIT family hydrolase
MNICCAGVGRQEVVHLEHHLVGGAGGRQQGEGSGERHHGAAKHRHRLSPVGGDVDAPPDFLMSVSLGMRLFV